MLTPRQRDVLLAIKRAIDETGVCPSYEQIAVAVGYSPRSKEAIHRIVKALVERSFLRHAPGRHRALEVLRLPGEPFIATEHSEVARLRAQLAEARSRIVRLEAELAVAQRARAA